MATDNSRLDVAVFIDFENVYVSVRDKLDVNPNFEIIMDRVADLGRVVIARAYADWYRYPRVTSALYANGIEPMYVPTYYYDRDLGRTGRAIKNSVDMNLCIDAMKTLFTNPNIGKFVLATGDRDFIPLVNSIRQQGKEVIIIGVGGAASGHLAQSADEFIFYEQLLGKKPQSLQPDTPRVRVPERGRDAYEADEPPPPRQRPAPAPSVSAAPPVEPPPPIEVAPVSEPDVFETLVQAVHLARERGYVCSFGSLKLLMKELMGGDFKESKYRDTVGRPFAKFKDFAMEAERRGKVQVFTSGAVVEVFLPGEDPYKLSQFAQDLKEEPPLSTPDTPVHVDARIDGRPVAANRRRRRRRGGSQRSAAAETFDTQSQDLTEDEELEYLPPEPVQETVNGSAQVDTMFEELLDRLEAERERQAALESFELPTPVETEGAEPPELTETPATISPEPEMAEETAPGSEATPDEEPAAPVETPAAEVSAEVVAEAPTAPVAVPSDEEPAQPFSDDEWQMLRDVVAAAGRALSFAQIHDLMREARNNTGVLRTNEELRSLIKQSINAGMLIRSGKGNRVSYRLAGAEPSVPAIEGETPVEEQAEAPVAEPVIETPPVAAPETASSEEAETAPVAVETAAVVEEPKAPKRRRAATRAKKEEPTVIAEPAPVAATKPAKASRARGKSDTAKATPEAKPKGRGKSAAAQAAPDASAETSAAPPAPRRRRRAATDTSEQS